MPSLFFRIARISTLALLSVAFLCLPVAAAESGSGEAPEEWYRVTVGGQNAGWMRLAVTHGNGDISTLIEQKMSFRRGQVELTVELSSNFVESSDGRPLEAWTRQILSGQKREAFYEFTPEAILVRSSKDGPVDRREPISSLPWLTPMQSQARLIEALAAGEKVFSIRTIDPSLGLEPIEVDWLKRQADVEISAANRTWVTSEWEQRQSWAPQLVTLVYVDDATGQLIRSETELFGMKVVQTLAEGDLSQQVDEAPEVLISTFVEPDRPLSRARETRRAVYELGTKNGLPTLPDTGIQTVRQEGKTARVTVDLSRRRKSAIDPAEYLQATTFFDHRDPNVQNMLGDLELADSDSEMEKALALRRLVYDSLESKNLDSIFDTASEVAVSRAGDCTEHSVLLTALLRGAGLPARSVMGLVYADEFLGRQGIFVYHMWSQAWIAGRWIDLDATLENSSFDAAHIALQIVALDDQQTAMRELAGMAPLMGELKIRVLEAELR